MTEQLRYIAAGRRRAVLILREGADSVECALDADNLSDLAWGQLRAGVDDAEMCVEARNFRQRLEATASALGRTLTLIADNGNAPGRDVGFLEFAWQVIEEETSGQGASPSKREKFRGAAKRFTRYLKHIGKEGLTMTNLNSTLIEDFNRWMLAGGLQASTCAFYNRILSAIYNRAVRAGLTPDNSPFAGVATQHRG